MPRAEERLDALEMRIAHQERVIEDLNAALTEQWARIDALLREIARLQDRLRDAETRTASAAAPEPPPPHY
jgi:SlyX protein